ncbi:MAG: glycosyltransferase [Candidatus Paraimprobicoccus trichonymphae]|uniref:Glycosyltransferase n=1 Tax=Candidatus Paraimprobicoccus trichonymphae TaxID=3033793 RepID=A0AA48I2B5_9FIRM|nr:MAG: glycosyltransferase [Candidatus Paraimprobicoccus trichonymphae]
MNENKIDILFMVGHYIPIFVFLVKFFIKSKIVFCDHGSLINQIEDKKTKLFRKIACKMSDKIIVLTKRNLKDYIKIFKVKSEKIDFIYNFIDENTYKCVYNYNLESRFIISAGRFSVEKGFNMLVEVANKVFKIHKNWQWHIFGDGPEFESIQNKILKYKLEKNLILKFKVDDLNKIYKNYSLFVLTSYREGLPMVLLEAKANKLPIVSFNCLTGPAEIVKNDINGFLINCYDKNEMADKINTLVENKILRKKFSENSYVDIEKFDKNIIIKKWENLIDNL